MDGAVHIWETQTGDLYQALPHSGEQIMIKTLYTASSLMDGLDDVIKAVAVSVFPSEAVEY